MVIPLGKYTLNIFRELYASYEATVINKVSKKSKLPEQPLLLRPLVHDVPIDISKATIKRFLYGPDFQPPAMIIEFNHRLWLAGDRQVMCDLAQRTDLIR